MAESSNKAQDTMIVGIMIVVLVLCAAGISFASYKLGMWESCRGGDQHEISI